MAQSMTTSHLKKSQFNFCVQDRTNAFYLNRIFKYYGPWTDWM